MPHQLYNTGSFTPRVLNDAVAGLGLTPEAREKIDTAMRRVDETFVSMLTVVELSKFLHLIKAEVPIVPLVYPGVYDTDTDHMFQEAVFDWSFLDTPCVLVAGQHAEADNAARLAPERLQQMFVQWTRHDIKVHSQVHASNTPMQAAWVADMVEELGLEAIAIRAHPFHGARAFLTQLSMFKKRGLDRKVVLIPWWRQFDPFGARKLTEPWPNDVWSDAALIPGEAKRIHDYSAKGDVASLEELQAYTDWLFHESPVAAALSSYTT